MYPDSYGTRLVFTDDKSDAFLYNPINDTTIDVPDFPPSAIGLLWDMGPLEKVLDSQHVIIMCLMVSELGHCLPTTCTFKYQICFQLHRRRNHTVIRSPLYNSLFIESGLLIPIHMFTVLFVIREWFVYSYTHVHCTVCYKRVVCL